MVRSVRSGLAFARMRSPGTRFPNPGSRSPTQGSGVSARSRADARPFRGPFGTARSIAARRVEIFYGVNARIWANPVSCSHITFFVGCSLLPPNRKSTGIRTIRTTPTLRGANQSSRTETHTPNPLLPLDLHYSIRNVHPCSTWSTRKASIMRLAKTVERGWKFSME